MIIEYSSICLDEKNYREKIDEARVLVEAAGYRFGLQLHNSISPELLELLLPLRTELPLSVHSPALASHFLNLASADTELTAHMADVAADVLRRAGTSVFFFHGMFLTDLPIVHSMRDYRKVMRESMGEGLALGDSFIMNPKVFESEKYALHKERFRRNLAWLAARHPDLTVALENDFVGIGSGLQRPQEILELVSNFWFDLGHFWASSLLHGFDFDAAAREIIETKRIVGVHLNHNFCTRSTPVEDLQDSHGHIWQPSAQNLAPLVRLLRDRGAPILTLEIINGDAQDVRTLLEWLEG